jgi:NodT family efflux transporter outer membrane factor (OMF) lipoprotein
MKLARFSPLTRFFGVSLSALALSACAAGPDYVAPLAPPTSSGPFISQSAAVSAAPVSADWWKLYNDPVLDGLIQDALKANTDIRVAVAHLEKARAALSGARSDRLPQGNVGAGATYGRVPVTQRAPGAPQEDWSVDAGLNVSYEVDLFGRVKRGVEAARGDAQAAEADAEAVRIAVIADTTRAYADAASGAAQLKVANHIVQLLDQLVDLTKRRHAAGFATQLDEARVIALREQRAADIPALEAQRQAALFRLATLTGRTPADLPEIATQRSIGLEIAQAIPVGDGAALLARRPDIRAAERRLAADTARIGVATADLYPKISLGGSIGSTGPNIADAFGVGPLRWLLGPLISWNLNPSATRAKINGAKADSQAALATFDGTVLNALQETETALSTYARALDRRRSLLSARNFAEQAATVARAQQKEGAIDGLQLLDTERTFADAQAALALQDAQVSGAQIDLFKALGGGWSKS